MSLCSRREDSGRLSLPRVSSLGSACTGTSDSVSEASSSEDSASIHRKGARRGRTGHRGQRKLNKNLSSQKLVPEESIQGLAAETTGSSLSGNSVDTTPGVAGNRRQRMMSGGSDIAVLPNPSRDNSLASNDIYAVGAVISAPSPLAVTVTTGDAGVTNPDADKNGDGRIPEPISELSPANSLTERTVHSMVVSVYENSVPTPPTDSGSKTSQSISPEDTDEPSNRQPSEVSENDIPKEVTCDATCSYTSGGFGEEPYDASLNPFETEEDHGGSSEEEEEEDTSSQKLDSDSDGDIGPHTGTTEIRDPQLVYFSFDDFSQIDHRLKLHLLMNVFEDEEEFSLALKVHKRVYSTDTYKSFKLYYYMYYGS